MHEPDSVVLCLATYASAGITCAVGAKDPLLGTWVVLRRLADAEPE